MLTQSAQFNQNTISEAGFRLARCISIADGQCVLLDNDYQLDATVAFSCLVSPQVDDTVLYAAVSGNTNIVTSIVSRPGSQNMSVEFPASAVLQSKKGSIDLNANKTISMSSESLLMFAQRMLQKTDHAHLDVQELNAHGEKLNASFSSMFLLSNFVSSSIKQAISKFRTYLRHSENFDQVKAMNMSRAVKGVYSMNSEQTIMQSRKDTKIDAERIHLG